MCVLLAEAEGGEPWGRGGLASERWEGLMGNKERALNSLSCGSWPRLWFTVQTWEHARVILILYEAVRGLKLELWPRMELNSGPSLKGT